VARKIAAQPLARGLLSESSLSRPRTKDFLAGPSKLSLRARARATRKTALLRAMLHEAISVTSFEGGGGKALLVTAPIPKGTVVWWENQDEEPDWVSIPRCRLYIDNLPAEARKIFEHYMYKVRPFPIFVFLSHPGGSYRRADSLVGHIRVAIREPRKYIGGVSKFCKPRLVPRLDEGPASPHEGASSAAM
jgi:hypothetical protein